VQVAVARSAARRAAAASLVDPFGREQAAQIYRLPAGQGLGGASRGHLAHARHPPQRAVGGTPGQLRRVQPGQRVRRRPEGADAVRGLVGTLQQERDPAQVGYGVSGGHPATLAEDGTGAGFGRRSPAGDMRDRPATCNRVTRGAGMNKVAEEEFRAYVAASAGLFHTALLLHRAPEDAEDLVRQTRQLAIRWTRLASGRRTYVERSSITSK
jgi:hypothetical protein